MTNTGKVVACTICNTQHAEIYSKTINSYDPEEAGEYVGFFMSCKTCNTSTPVFASVEDLKVFLDSRLDFMNSIVFPQCAFCRSANIKKNYHSRGTLGAEYPVYHPQTFIRYRCLDCGCMTAKGHYSAGETEGPPFYWKSQE